MGSPALSRYFTAVGQSVFWIAAVSLVLAKLAMVADFSVEIAFSPHDDSLYIERAFHLLHGEAFGPYDSRILIKYPGISLWLAAVRSLGIPYLLSIQLLYIGAGLYFSLALMRAGTPRWVVLIALALYLFNPVTFGTWWTRVLREPLATGLFVLLLGAWLHIIIAAERRERATGHALVGALTFAFALYVREDDLLLWVLFAGLGAAVLWQLWRARTLASRIGLETVLLAVVLPAAAAVAAGFGIAKFIEHNYGAPIIHELSQGEYPRLLAAIRSIKTTKDNRMVMAPQEALAKLRTQVPMFAPVVARLPAPGPLTFSCTIHRVCSEWSNGWMLFWIRDAAFDAGFTPDLVSGQAYFRSVRAAIDKACAERRFECRDAGTGLIPPMELRWTRAYVHEFLNLVRLALRPDPAIAERPPALFNVNPDLGRRFQAVTMTDYYDTQWQTTATGEPQRSFQNPLAKWRSKFARAYLLIAPLILIAMVGAVLLRLASSAPLDAFTLTASVVLGFVFVRLLVIAYICTFMGPVDSRMLLTTFIVGMLLAVPYLFHVYPVLRLSKS